MKKEYMTLLEAPEKIRGPVELTLTLRDMEPGRRKYRTFNASATVSPGEIEGADVLWVRYSNGVLMPKPWSIKITRELDDFFPGRPYSGVVD